jgi:hypothetical protein
VGRWTGLGGMSSLAALVVLMLWIPDIGQSSRPRLAAEDGWSSDQYCGTNYFYDFIYYLFLNMMYQIVNN